MQKDAERRTTVVNLSPYLKSPVISYWDNCNSFQMLSLYTHFPCRPLCNQGEIFNHKWNHVTFIFNTLMTVHCPKSLTASPRSCILLSLPTYLSRLPWHLIFPFLGSRHIGLLKFLKHAILSHLQVLYSGDLLPETGGFLPSVAEIV